MLDIRTGHVALRVLHDGTAVTGLLVVRPDGCGIISAPSVILATGGLGHLYSATTNPAGSTGDGIAWDCGRASRSAISSSSSSTPRCFLPDAPGVGGR